ncbi:hypothetical protein HA402_003507 [Bradysia odoriphaga]|nr:hypothetical protein HA402_003507 [Bradysia odoriphaga]
MLVSIFVFCSNSENANNTRTIQRLVGGHIHHLNYRKDENENPQTTRLSKIYFRRKQLPIQNATTEASNAYVQKVKSKLDDAEFLSDDNKLDGGLIGASAGDGKHMPAEKKDESKKTLADQVAEGKYGLIQTEIFDKTPKRPGVISYLPNPEVPNDTASNYGGLDEEDIWLAEDHLLVLKGGNLNNKHKNDPWKPIDDYEAPERQVKIPDNPRVPPPFLVQLQKDGPIQFISNNQFPLINPFTNESLLLFPEGGFPKAEAFDSYKKDIFARPGTNENSTNTNGYQYLPPVMPWNYNDNQTFVNPFVNMQLPPFPFPFPNGSLENSNITDYFDEDDPSLYYPPPYSFVYKSNYSNPVPPGPLVPGIILPPPPDFFGRLDTPTTTAAPTTTTTVKQYKQVIRPITRVTTIRPVTLKLKPKQSYVTEKIISTSPLSTRPTTSTTTTTMRTVTQLKKITDVPPEIISFVPRDAIANKNMDAMKGNPIYFEYFDAKVNQPTTTSYYNAEQSTQPLPVSYKVELQQPPKALYKQSEVTQLRPQKKAKRPYNAYLPLQPFDYDKYVYITPKPEITPNGISNNVIPTVETISNRPLQSFHKEVDTIRQTLQYYKNPQNPYDAQRKPKTKAVYEYSFDASNGNQNKQFIAPTTFDTTPFKPMVQYSTLLNAENEFRAMPYTTEYPQNYYSSTGNDFENNPSPRVNGARNYSPKKPVQQYLPNKYGNDVTSPPHYEHPQKDTQSYDQFNYFNTNAEYTTNHSPVQPQQQQPWISIEKQVFREIHPKDVNVQSNSRPLQVYPQQGYPQQGYQQQGYQQQGHQQQGQYDHYYYKNPNRPTYPNVEQNYQKYPTTKSPNAYYKQIESIRQQLRRYPQNQQEISLVNDTAVNYKNPRPAINPDAEYINVNQYNQHKVQQQQQQQIPQRLPPQPLNPNNFYHPQPIPLKQDILVNYKYPLPEINPDSEWLPEDLRRYNRRYQNPAIHYKLPGDHQAGVYFFTPQEKRYQTD